ncbi:AMP-binding protein [Streptomyces sp. NPDC005402]|uniref:AMP-binding protein n=1 Tax=Streptomyces sp. NPDC005402 TaxID=3155338 RepID=UPI0033B4EF9D
MAVARVRATGVEKLPYSARQPRTATGPDSPAYIIFTSGTTGVPKGVVVSRSALASPVRGEGPRFDIGTASRVLLVAPPVVDPWICHVAGPLLCGATLVQVDPGGGDLAGDLARARVTHAFLPAPLVPLLTGADLPTLQVLASAGDHCRLADLATFAGKRLFNIYGPTEATVTAAVATDTDTDTDTDTVQPVPVGPPIQGLGARILIDGAATAPPGVTGHLMLTGAGVALGYLDDPDLTRARFRRDPQAPGRPGYLTGDRAWLRPDGQLVIAGRTDRQVKIRGMRAELDAVESAARATGHCTDAYATTRDAAGSSDKHPLAWMRCPTPASAPEFERRTGRFAVDVRVGDEASDPVCAGLVSRIRDLAVPTAGENNRLSYEATITFQRQGRIILAILDFDPDQIAEDHAGKLLAAPAAAMQSTSTPSSQNSCGGFPN